MKKLSLKMFDTSKISNLQQLKHIKGGAGTFALTGWGTNLPGTEDEYTYNDWSGDEGNQIHTCCNTPDGQNPFDYCVANP